MCYNYCSFWITLLLTHKYHNLQIHLKENYSIYLNSLYVLHETIPFFEIPNSIPTIIELTLHPWPSPEWPASPGCAGSFWQHFAEPSQQRESLLTGGRWRTKRWPDTIPFLRHTQSLMVCLQIWIQRVNVYPQ